MTTTLQNLGIDRLSVDERIALVQQIWDSIAAEAERAPLTEAQRQELENRADDDDANPADTIPWQQIISKPVRLAVAIVDCDWR